METGLYWQIIYWLSTPTLGVLVVVLLVRGLPRRLPIFFCYILVAFLDDIARFLAYHKNPLVYADVYWISQFIDSLLSFLAISELFLRRVFPQFQKIGFYRLLFSVVGVLIAAVGVLTAFHTIQIRALVNILHGLDFLRVAALIFFVGLMLFMGRQWGRYEFGIALGFGVDATAFLGSFAIWDSPGFGRLWAKNMPAVAFDLACLIWLITFLRRESPVADLKSPGPKVLEEAKKWEETLKDSFIKKKNSAGKTDS